MRKTEENNKDFSTIVFALLEHVNNLPHHNTIDSVIKREACEDLINLCKSHQNALQYCNLEENKHIVTSCQANIELRKKVSLYLENKPLALQKFGPIRFWDTRNVTDMSGLFEKAHQFNEELTWDTGNVTSMRRMFNGATRFNNGGQPLNFDTKNVTNMEDMFRQATVFNQLINYTIFKTNKVTTMQGMFEGAELFDQYIPFDTKNVTGAALANE